MADARRVGQSRRLLVVDDEPIVHTAVRLVLRREFEIVDKMSAEDALDDLETELERGDFDIVLLDVRMPGVPDGVDFFRQLQQMDPARAPAVIFMTGDPHIASVLETTMRTTCLAKPFAADQLRAAIAEIRAEERPSGPASIGSVR
jgi:CheY-like chemotaxis protein